MTEGDVDEVSTRLFGILLLPRSMLATFNVI